jgi:hypothetical protein
LGAMFDLQERRSSPYREEAKSSRGVDRGVGVTVTWRLPLQTPSDRKYIKPN